MKAPLIRDIYHRHKFKDHEERVRLFRALKANTIFGLSAWARQRLDCLPIYSYQNRCLITNRGKATLRKFKLSRQEFKRWAASSRLPGVGPKR